MSGVQNNPIGPSATPLPRLMRMAPAAATPAAAPLGTDQLALGGGAPDPAAAATIAGLRARLFSGTEVEAVMALSQLEAMAGANRAAVLPVLMEALQSGYGDLVTSGTVQSLQRLKATEALPVIQRLASGGSGMVAQSAATALRELGGTPPAPSAPATPAAAPAAVPGAAPQAVDPARPLTSAAAQAPAPPAAQAGSQHLIDMLSRIDTAPGAAVELARLPVADMLKVTEQVLYKDLEPKCLDLVVTVLARRIKEPGVAAQLQQFMKKDPSAKPTVSAKAALALLSTRDPAYTPDIMRLLVVFNSRLNPVKRAIVDQMAKDPRYLAHPAAGPVFASVLKAQEDDNLSASASHALGLIKTKAARDALAKSPLFRSTDPKLRMRALWDLGNHPAPYPPDAVANLRNLANDADKTVAAKAKELLNKKG